MKDLITELESKVKNCHNTNTIFDTRNYVLLDDVRKLIAAINYTHCCKSDSELLAEHKCKFYVNADWSYLKCSCGKRIKPSEG